MAETNRPDAPEAGRAPRSPAPWILGWGVYSLLALGYLGYQSAWLNAVCMTR